MDKAVALTNEILGRYKNKISELKLIPAKDGVYEIYFNDDLIFSKKELKRYPEDGEINSLIKDKIK